MPPAKQAAPEATTTDPTEPRVGPTSSDPILKQEHTAAVAGRTASGHILDAAQVADLDLDPVTIEVTDVGGGTSKDVWVHGLGNHTFVVGEPMAAAREVLNELGRVGVAYRIVDAKAPAEKAKE